MCRKPSVKFAVKKCHSKALTQQIRNVYRRTILSHTLNYILMSWKSLNCSYSITCTIQYRMYNMNKEKYSRNESTFTPIICCHSVAPRVGLDGVMSRGLVTLPPAVLDASHRGGFTHLVSVSVSQAGPAHVLHPSGGIPSPLPSASYECIHVQVSRSSLA